MIDLVGWLATAVFLSSYLVRPAHLLKVQILGALIWVAYGVLLQASPIVVANLLLVAVATWSRRRRQQPT